MRLANFELSSTEISSDAEATADLVTATITLDTIMPYDVPVLIGTSDAELKVPKRVIIAPGQLTKTFKIGSGSIIPLKQYHIWAQIEETVFRQKLVLKLPGIASLLFSPSKLDGGSVTRLTVTLDHASPGTGALVNLTEVLGYQGEIMALLLDMPASLFITAGSTTAYCDITTRDWDGGREPPPREVNTAVDAIYGDVSKRAILTVTDP